MDYRRVCSKCLASDVKWLGVTPYGEVYKCTGGCNGNVTPCFLEVATPVEDVTFCVVCGDEIVGYSNKKTCSAKCRKRLSRMVRQ